MAEINAIDRWLFTTLTGDAALTAVIGTKVYADIVWQATPPIEPPYAIYSMLSGVDLRVVGPYRVWSDCLYIVKMVAESNTFAGVLKTGADRIEAVINVKSGSNVDGIVDNCYRVQPLRLAEPPVNGRIYRQLGGIYRIRGKVA